jgi:FlgN protein
MIPLIEQLITALREELTHYGEMLARLDHQQDLVVRRQPDEILQSVGSIQAQAAALRTARDQRERCRQELLSRLASFAPRQPSWPCAGAGPGEQRIARPPSPAHAAESPFAQPFS